MPLKDDFVVVIKVSDFNNILDTLIWKNIVILPNRSCASLVSVSVCIYTETSILCLETYPEFEMSEIISTVRQPRYSDVSYTLSSCSFNSETAHALKVHINLFLIRKRIL